MIVSRGTLNGNANRSHARFRLPFPGIGGGLPPPLGESTSPAVLLAVTLQARGLRPVSRIVESGFTGLGRFQGERGPGRVTTSLPALDEAAPLRGDLLGRTIHNLLWLSSVTTESVGSSAVPTIGTIAQKYGAAAHG